MSPAYPKDRTPSAESSEAASHETKERAAARLKMSAYKPVRHVQCEVDRGVLWLRGRLQTFFLKQVAQEAVANLEGVRQIVNQIEVSSRAG
jgi:osmotically-inducible protein OsmY